MTVGGHPSAFSIAEAAERAGLTTHTMRYYERDGLLLRPVGRSSSGHRRYTMGDLEWVQLITSLRATGMPIKEIRAYAALCRAENGNEDQRLALLETHRERVLAELAEVTEHLGAIDRKIGIYTDTLHALEQRSD